MRMTSCTVSVCGSAAQQRDRLVTVDVDVAVDGMDQPIRQVFAAARCSSVMGTSREWLVTSDLVSECEGGFHLDEMCVCDGV